MYEPTRFDQHCSPYWLYTGTDGTPLITLDVVVMMVDALASILLWYRSYRQQLRACIDIENPAQYSIRFVCTH